MWSLCPNRYEKLKSISLQQRTLNESGDLPGEASFEGHAILAEPAMMLDSSQAGETDR